MNGDEVINGHDREAADYDRQAKDYQWYGPEILFGLGYEYIHPRELVLDVGIGTGLGSELLARAGLVVHGMDASSEMLEICRNKDFAEQLFQFDIRRIPWPYEDETYDHIFCSGVFHFFENLDLLFSEIYRIVKFNGICAFTVKYPNDPAESGLVTSEYYEEEGVQVYSHSAKYINQVLATNGLTPLKCCRFLVLSDPVNMTESVFQAWLAAKTP